MSRRKRGWLRILGDAARFHLNKIRHGYLKPGQAASPLGEAAGDGLLKEIRVAGRDGSGRLEYCVMRDSSGQRQGFQFPWIHVENLLTCADNKAREIVLRRLLARLPAGVCFNFVLGKGLAHTDVIARTFRNTGFLVSQVDTFFHTPVPGDQIDALTGKSIKGTLRRARRDLEVLDISPRDFVTFHKHNIEAIGRQSYRDSDIDCVIFELGCSTQHARILGARRRTTAENQEPFPLDAAIACTWDCNLDIYKFVRLTHRPGGDGNSPDAPHPDAAKLLLLTAMENAAALGLTFDTDGTTPGMTKVYALFGPGVFQPAIRIQCTRDTIWSVICKNHPTSARIVSRALRVIAPRSPQ